MKKYKAILFDMDGVIADSMRWHAESWQRVFHEHNMELSTEDIYKREGMPGLPSIVEIIRERGGVVPDEDGQRAMLRRKLEIFESTSKVKIFPCVPDILEMLKSRKKLLGLVTGSLRRSVEFVLPGNILNMFDVIITVDDIKNGKPHPEPYLKAMGLLGCTPDETLVIENAPLGIISAKEAGASCFAVETTLDVTFLSDADIIFSNHESLLDYFKKNL